MTFIPKVGDMVRIDYAAGRVKKEKHHRRIGRIVAVGAGAWPRHCTVRIDNHGDGQDVTVPTACLQPLRCHADVLGTGVRTIHSDGALLVPILHRLRLKRQSRIKPKPPPGAAKEPVECPKCQHVVGKRVGRDLYLGGVVIHQRKTLTCTACGWKWQYRPNKPPPKVQPPQPPAADA